MTSPPSSKRRTEEREIGAPAAAAPHPIHALLEGIVDYAGLFPPAGLDMRSAAEAYDRYRSGEHAWMLGTFVVPAARLDELTAAAATLRTTDVWPISTLATSAAEGTKTLRDARGWWAGRFDVRAVEIAPQDRIVALDEVDDVQVFHEVPLDERMEARLDAIAKAGVAAKVRTGGVEAKAFPNGERFAAFMGACAKRSVPFKATAGLHHPLGGRYPLTYEEGSAQCTMFGFLEVVLTAALLWHGRIEAHEAAELLGGRATNVEVSPGALVWAGHRSSVDEIAEVRRKFFRSFGSCSFEEPVTDLTRLGLLPGGSAA